MILFSYPRDVPALFQNTPWSPLTQKEDQSSSTWTRCDASVCFLYIVLYMFSLQCSSPLYLPFIYTSLQVSHTRPEEITFRIHQKLNVGVLQPAAVSVYEHNDGQHSNRETLRNKMHAGSVCDTQTHTCEIWQG